jgi:hypothetical protein
VNAVYLPSRPTSQADIGIRLHGIADLGGPRELQQARHDTCTMQEDVGLY